MWLRSLLLLFMWIGLAATAWLATHRSADPEVLGRWSRSYAWLLGASLGASLLLLLCSVPPLFGRLYAARFRVALLLLLVVAVPVGLEAAARKFDPLGVSHVAEVQRYRAALVDAGGGLRLHAPLHRAVYQGAAFTTNELGLRERPMAQLPDGYRVVVLGDESTLGFGVAAEQAVPRRLEALLGEQLGTPVAVVHAAVGGSDTVQEAALLDRHFEALRPDAVVLVFAADDAAPGAAAGARVAAGPGATRSLRDQSPPEVVATLLRKSWAVRLALHVRGRDAGGAFTDAGVGGLAAGGPGAARGPGAAEWSRSLEALRSIARRCAAADVRFAVAFHATPAQEDALVRAGASASELLDAVRAVGGELSFPVFDTRPWFAGVERATLVNTPMDPCWNARGHDLFARKLVGALLAQPMLGS